MATQKYRKAAEALADGNLDWEGDSIVAVLLSDAASYTPDFDADEFLSDIPSGAQHTISNALTGKSNTLGVLDATDLLVEGVNQAGSESIVAIALVSNTGTPSTSRLWAYIDNMGEVPFPPNGSDVTIVWDDGANKIMKI